MAGESVDEFLDQFRPPPVSRRSESWRRHQQNIKSFNIAILVLSAKKNSYDALCLLIPKALETRKRIKAGEVVA